MRLLTHRAYKSGFLFAAGMALLLALAILLLALVDAQAAGLAYPDIQLNRADASGVDFTFTPRAWSVDTGFADGDVVSFADAQFSTEPGAPAVPQRSVLVAVPPDGNISITAEPAAWQNASQRGAATRSPALNAAAARPAAPPLVRWDGPFRSRELRLVRIWLAPVRSANGRLSRTDAVSVSVRWEGNGRGQSLSRNTVFDPVYERTLLNWDQAQNFAATATRSALLNPWAGGTDWFKVTVQTDGPHRLTQSELSSAGFPVSGDPRQFRMFYTGGKILPVPGNAPRPVLHEVPIEITGESDGSFDAGDVIYFFGQAPNRWENNDSDAVYVNNPYTRDVVFWLASDGSFAGSPLRVGTRSATPGADPLVSQGIARAVAEQNLILDHDIDDFYTWFWQNSKSLSVVMNLPGARMGAGWVAVSSRVVFNASWGQVVINDSTATFGSSSGLRAQYSTSKWLPTTTVQLTYTRGTETVWYDRVEAAYPADLDAGVLRDFWISPALGNNVRIANVPAGALLWDVTAVDSPFVVAGQVSGSTLTFDPGATTHERRFRLWTRPEAKSTTAVIASTPGLLRDAPPAADLVIIAHPSVRAGVDAYASWRATQSGITVEVVDVLDIYRDFGFGQLDPVAIRDFLEYAYQAALPRPSACLLVGDGSYDFLDHEGTGTANLVPPFIVSNLLDDTAGDQLFVSFGPLGTLDMDTSRTAQTDRGWDMMVGRWPVRDASEVQTVIQKIEAYESQPELGSWRNRVVMVADDEFGESSVGSEYFHTEQAEGIDSEIPASYDRRKVYLFEYPRDATGNKPEARNDIISAWNDGMLLIDYVGHGSPNVWAHEDVFRRTRDLPQLANGDRLPLVYTASCSIGLFDDPHEQGMGEELLRLSGGGGIGVISATRLVFSQPNIDLNRAVFQYLFDPIWLTVGQALFAGLIQRQYMQPSPPPPLPIENDRKYVLLGDPFMRLARPTYAAAFDTALVPDTLVALRPVRVAGTVADSLQAPVDLGGHFDITVRDAPRERQYEVQTRTVLYTLEGRTLFEGAFPATSPSFDVSIMIPKDVSYGQDGARIVVYQQGTTSDALGVLAPLPISNSADSTNDAAGPGWQVTINGVPPSGRVTVGPADVWRAVLNDPLGINIGGTPGHGITLTTDGDQFTARDLTGLFRYDVGSMTTGSLTFSLASLPPGPHELSLLAWDNANNPSSVGVSVEGTGDVEYEIRELLVYPNPFDPDVEPATLTYELTFPPERVELALYTVAGHRIRTFDDPAADIGFNFATRWDGTDDVGDRVAAGIYILAVEAEGLGHKVKDFTKVVLIRSD